MIESTKLLAKSVYTGRGSIQRNFMLSKVIEAMKESIHCTKQSLWIAIAGKPAGQKVKRQQMLEKKECYMDKTIFIHLLGKAFNNYFQFWKYY